MTGGVTEALAGPDAAVWHQEADLSDPGAPSRLIESAVAFSRFLDIRGGHHADLSSAAGTLWSGQVQNLRSALTKLQSAVSTLATQRNASGVSGVVTALGGVSAAARQLLDAASPSCPSPSASSG